MIKFIRISLTVVAVLVTCAMPGQAARFHGGWGWGWGPAVGLGLWGLTYPYYGYPYYPSYGQAPVVLQQPTTEVYEQPVEPTYWYYCQKPEGYYPYVKRCPSGWMKVVPSPPPDR